MRWNVAVGWFLPCDATDKCKISAFSLQKTQWLNFDSNSTQLTQLWLKWRLAWFDSDSFHILDIHGRLNSDSTRLGRSRVKFNSRHMTRVEHNPDAETMRHICSLWNKNCSQKWTRVNPRLTGVSAERHWPGGGGRITPPRLTPKPMTEARRARRRWKGLGETVLKHS